MERWWRFCLQNGEMVVILPSEWRDGGDSTFRMERWSSDFEMEVILRWSGDSASRMERW